MYSLVDLVDTYNGDKMCDYCSKFRATTECCQPASHAIFLLCEQCFMEKIEDEPEEDKAVVMSRIFGKITKKR